MPATSLTRFLTGCLTGAWQVRALDASVFCRTYRAESATHAPLFVKVVTAERAAVLQAEADGLAALAATRTVRVPRVIACAEAAGQALLALEWLDFAPAASPEVGPRFGHALAQLHRAPPPGDGRFGWHRDNWLGATPQGNAWSTAAGPRRLDPVRRRAPTRRRWPWAWTKRSSSRCAA